MINIICVWCSFRERGEPVLKRQNAASVNPDNSSQRWKVRRKSCREQT